MSCPAGRLTCWRRGCAGIPACRSYAATGPAPTARRSAAPCPARSRPVIAGRPVAQPGRSRAERGRRAQHLLGGRRAAAELRQAGPDDSRAMAPGPRPHRQGHRAAGRCSRRLGLSLNTVKRYARAAEPERMIRAPATGPPWWTPTVITCAARRAADPAVPIGSCSPRSASRGLSRQHEPALPLHHPGPGRS